MPLANTIIKPRGSSPRNPESSLAPEPYCHCRQNRPLVLPLPPSLNALYATFRGRRILSAHGRAYKRQVASQAILQCCKIIDGPVSVTATIYFPDRRGDLLNREKCLFDALNGVAWKDDSKIEEAHFYRKIDKLAPRAELTIEPKG